MSPKRASRVVCCCRSCQNYARHLGHEENLDEHGGTDVFQTAPSRMVFSEGQDQIACLRMSPKGPLRWYAGCCKTPLANTLKTSKVPFIAIQSAILDASALDGGLDAALGPVKARVNRRFPKDQAKALKATKGDLVPMLFRLSGMMLGWKFTGGGRSPFFDASGAPISSATLVPKMEAQA